MSELDELRKSYAPLHHERLNRFFDMMEKDKIDAERWCALMSSQRMHFIGRAGFDWELKSEKDLQKSMPVPRPGTYQHFGMEFWSEPPGLQRSEIP